jgi:Zn-dependent protease/CBS domain-containing protein
MEGIKLGKILGFEINIDWSWLLVFALVVWSLASGYFPSTYPEFGVATNWLMGILAALLLFASVLIHELSHSLVARQYGTQVKGITLFLFGGVSQTTDEPKSAGEEFWMAIVGPVTSLVLAAIFYMVGGAGKLFMWPPPVIAICGYLAMINMLLGMFNLVPGFPLDGGRVLRSAIWGATGDLNKATRYAAAVGQGFGYILMGLGLLRIVAGDLIGGLWLVFIGWFLTGAARSSYQQMLMREALTGIRVEQVMSTDVPVIDGDVSVRRFVDDHLLRHEFSCYPVVNAQNEGVLGVVGAEEVRKVPAEEWDRTPVRQIAHRIDGEGVVTRQDDAWEALSKLASGNLCRLLVMEDGHLAGTVGREAMFRLVQTKMNLGV